MPVKKVQIVLEDYRAKGGSFDRSFRVAQTVNFTSFEIGQFLSKKEVDELCLVPNYTVTIKAPK